MITLSKESFLKAKEFILNSATEPDKAMFHYYFENGSKENVLKALSKYQNTDGGFGGLEYDFELEQSSGMATLKAFQYFKALDLDSNNVMIQKGIKYFLEICDKQWLCFHSLPPEVNNVPHAFWWTYEEPSEPLNANDLNWGKLLDEYNPNTNAEIVAYLLQYRDLIPPQFPLELLKKIAVDKINTFDKELDMHAFFCYTKLWDVVDLKDKDIIGSKLLDLIVNSIERDPEKWGEYSAQPIMFVDTPLSLGANLIKDEIGLNLDYLIRTQNEDGSWSPNWSWGGGDNEEAWQRAKVKWQGYLTLKNILKLSAFGRLKGQNAVLS